MCDHQYENMAPFTKPEVHNVLHDSQKMTEPRTSTENFANYGHAFLRYASGQTDIQTR